MSNVLEIDPKVLGREFRGEWFSFSTGKPHTFLVQWLLKRKTEIHRSLESAIGDDVLKCQGRVAEINMMLNLLRMEQIEPELRTVVQYLENKK